MSLPKCTVIQKAACFMLVALMAMASEGMALERHKGSVGGGALYMVQDDGTVVRYGGGTYYLSYAGKGGEEVFQLPGLENIVGIEAGIKHALALDKDGCIWAWGANSENQLGFQEKQRVKNPNKYTSLCNIKDFNALGYSSIILDTDDIVRYWGSGVSEREHGSRHEFKVSIEKVYSGAATFFAISEKGEVYAWGRPGREPLLPSQRQANWEPEKLSIPCSVDSIDFPFGYMFVCQNGDVYAIGDSTSGSLGTGNMKTLQEIKKHPTLSDVVKIQGGGLLRIAKLKNGTYVGWGDQIIAPAEASNQGYMLTPYQLEVPEGTVDFYSSNKNIYFVNKNGNVAELIPEEHWFWPYKYVLEDYHFKTYRSSE